MRLGELAGLRWDDVNLLEGEIVVSPAVHGRAIGTTKSEEPRDGGSRPRGEGQLLEEWYR